MLNQTQLSPTGVPAVSAQCGPFRVHVLLAQTFAMDAGALMGIVPRPLWEPLAGAPDAANRLHLGAAVLVIEAAHRRILVDAHLGWKLSPKFAAIHDWQSLAADWHTILKLIGLTPESITDVFLSHLHFDHCGGATTGNPEQPLAFPQARIHIQQAQWDWARNPSSRDRASYLPANLDPLAASDQLRLHPDGPSAAASLAEGLPTAMAQAIEVRTTHGHTPGLQNLLLRGEVTGPSVPAARGILTGIDLIPDRLHIKPVWVYAFDHYPLVTVQERESILREVQDGDLLVIGTHEGGQWPLRPWCAGFKILQGPQGPEPGECWIHHSPVAHGSAQ
jgi:glyoxylase-like metal-dependent hydrolase (beta-lactamase superfamily II)